MENTPTDSLVIPLTRGLFTVIDRADLPLVEPYRWIAHQVNGGRHTYACRRTTDNGPNMFVYLHRELMGNPPDMQVDHANGCTLDNRRSNLRVCTSSQNGANRRKNTNSKSGYKGVTWHQGTGRWFARLGRSGKYHASYHQTAVEAAKAYDRAAIEKYGEFARVNFPRPGGAKA